MEILKSKKEQEREARNSAIMADYCQMLHDYPEAKAWRILRTIADKYELPPEGVKWILISKGAYVAPVRLPEQV